MKTSLHILIAVLLTMTMALSAEAKKPSYSEKEKAKIEKEARKEAKKTAKELKKEGWNTEQSGLMEYIIARHIIKRDVEGLREIQGTSVDKKTRSLCRKQIQIDVPNAYAKEQSQVVKGVIVNKDKNKDGEESEDFVSEYETRMAMEIAGELQESYSIYRKNQDGTYDMQIYYLIDPETAHAAKLRAAKYSMEIQKLDEEWRKSISDAINSTKD